MLSIQVPLGPECWDEETERFVKPEYQTLELEHSLVSISKWESKWHKAYLTDKEKSFEEVIDYIKCMTLTEHVDPDVYNNLTQQNINQINEYITNPMTATVINEHKNGNGGGRSREVITSELIYYWMIAQQIPSEYQYWHINRLLTLIRVCTSKTSTPDKRSKGDIMRSHAALNKANRARYNSKG